MIDAHGETTFSRQSCYFQGTAMYASYGDVIGVRSCNGTRAARSQPVGQIQVRPVACAKLFHFFHDQADIREKIQGTQQISETTTKVFEHDLKAWHGDFKFNLLASAS